MKRREFLRNTVASSTGMIIFPSFAKAEFPGNEQALSELEKYFINPPDSARPWCFWMWMNGNITKEGITADLEAMKRMGIGGVINFNSAVGIPRGPVDYAGKEWMDATAHAVREADRLGISYSIHNSPGYSGCGGPWVTPEMSMQQLVWTEMLVTSNGEINFQLPKPYSKHHYYRDAFVIAYPSLPAEKALMKDQLLRVWLNGTEIDKQLICDRNPETMIRLEVQGATNALVNATAYDISTSTVASKETRGSASKNSSLVLEFREPFEARAITIYRKPEIPRDLFDGPRDYPTPFKLEYSDDNISYRQIGIIRLPELREMDTPASLSFNAVKAKYYRLTITASNWLSEVELHNGPRLGGWSGKTSNTHGDSNGDTPSIEPENIIDPSKIIDISDELNSDGSLQCKLLPGRWTLLRIGHTTTGEECAAHPDAGKGLEIDKFRKEALQFHFDRFLDRFINKVKPFIGKSFKGITVDSYEAGKQNWTKDFDHEFKNRKGYDLVKWMPVLTGRIVGSVTETENVLWDTRRVQADLLSENFYGHYQKLCHDRGLEFYAEPYGDGNLDSLQIGEHLDITMSEFWTRYIYGSDVYSKQAVSAAHTYGKKIVAAESFTAMPATAKWTDYPYSLKAEGDYFFSLGVNRLVFHTFVHQPYMTGKPGMTMGPFGMHIDRNNTWTDQAYGWTKYIQRSQFLLQQGLNVADICYFKGDNPESGVPDVYRLLPTGYHADVIGPDALHKRLSVKNGKIILPDGMCYQFMVMAPLQQVLPSTMNRIMQLVNEGMVLVVSSRPLKSFGNVPDGELVAIVNELYANLDGKSISERSFGKGKVIWNSRVDEVLKRLGIEPDFFCTKENTDAAIHYSHKKIGDDEFYFISNQKRKKERIVCSFRTTGKQPEIWNAENGSIYDAVLFEAKDGRTDMPLELEAAGSLLVVFRKKAPVGGFTSVKKDGKLLFSTKAFKESINSLHTEVQDNFCISVWMKPDTFAHTGRSMIFHAPEGELVYGNGHAAMALSAGQNAIRIFERTKGNAKPVLSYESAIAGWTHVVVKYTNGAPSLFVNGKEVAHAAGSSNKVHPGLGTAASQEQYTTYFEGNYTKPELLSEPLSNLQIQNLYKKALPTPILPSGIQFSSKASRITALCWENGSYELEGMQGKLIGNIKECKSIEILGGWNVKFPSKSGAPSEIVLPDLFSLHKHGDLNVKHFSGTCEYFKQINVSREDLLPGKRIFLHLGRVEVIAEVKVNGRMTGLLWKEPFMIEVGSFLKEGVNSIEVAVTNLWPNRLIGDEQLPVENEFSKDKFIKELPGWFVRNQEKPGLRKSFSVWKTHDKNDPLLESGLLGPVHLLTAIEKHF